MRPPLGRPFTLRRQVPDGGGGDAGLGRRRAVGVAARDSDGDELLGVAHGVEAARGLRALRLGGALPGVARNARGINIAEIGRCIGVARPLHGRRAGGARNRGIADAAAPASRVQARGLAMGAHAGPPPMMSAAVPSASIAPSISSASLFASRRMSRASPAPRVAVQAVERVALGELADGGRKAAQGIADHAALRAEAGAAMVGNGRGHRPATGRWSV